MADRATGAFHNQDVLAAIAYELSMHDLGNYSAAERAPWTKAKGEMLDASAGDVEKWMIENADSPPLCYVLVSVDEIVQSMPPDVKQTRTRGLREHIGDVLKRKFAGENLGQVRFGGRGADRPRLWALNRNTSGKIKQGQLKDATLAEIHRDERRPGTSADEAQRTRAAREAMSDFADEEAQL
jgi:hypothetical protein